MKTVDCRNCAYCEFDKDTLWKCNQHCIGMGEKIMCGFYKDIGDKWKEDFLKGFKEDLERGTKI
jgi:hypothetical protein